MGIHWALKAESHSLKIYDIRKGFTGKNKNRAIFGLEACTALIENRARAVDVEGEFDWLRIQIESLKKHDRTGEVICSGGSNITPEHMGNT